jgi:Chalcone isomerase-like
VYEAQLWCTEDTHLNLTHHAALNSSFANQSFALELRYLRSLAGDAIAERSLKEIQKLGLGSAAQHQVWLTQMKALLPSVNKGDRITGVHLAGVGAAFYLNDQPLGRIDDPRFAQAFFAIWLDPKTSAPALRSALLNARPS